MFLAFVADGELSCELNCTTHTEALQSVKARKAAEEKSFDADLATATALGDAAAMRCDLETAIDKYTSEVSQ